jgi:hypothetical protein
MKGQAMKLKPQPSGILVALTILFILILPPAHAQADAVADWNLYSIQRIGAEVPQHPTPLVFVDMAIVQIAVYDAVQAIEKDYKPYHVQIPGASGSPTAAAAKAARDVLIYLLPGQSMAIDIHYHDYLADLGIPETDPGVAVGTTAAAGIISLRSGDGRNPPGQVPFVGGTGLGEWRPTDSFITPKVPAPFSPMAAPWIAKVTPFTLKSGDQFRAVAPPPLNSHRYTEAYNEVKVMGARFNSARTDEQTKLAYFWALNYPAVWNRVVRDIASSQNLSISEHARLSAFVNLSMADAIITSWDSKIAYPTWRPLTAIRLGHDDTNPDTVGDPTWEPLVNTPNYPDYTSGANNVSAAATRSLALYFGTDEMTFTVFTTNTTAGIPASITYSKFSYAAEDVVNARIWEGIHFRFADEEAWKQGRHVAQWVFGHVLKPID